MALQIHLKMHGVFGEMLQVVYERALWGEMLRVMCERAPPWKKRLLAVPAKDTSRGFLDPALDAAEPGDLRL